MRKFVLQHRTRGAVTALVGLFALGVFVTATPAFAIVEASTNHAVAPVAKNVAPVPAVPPGQISSPNASVMNEDIRDIRPPYHIPPGWMWAVWVAIGIAGLVAGYLLWRWRRRLPGMRTRPAFELALEQLEAARIWMTPEQAREFSVRVSEAVRSYIEVRFAVRAAHQTTEEFLHNRMADPNSPIRAHRALLGDFLMHCDLAKFARWVLSVPEMEAMLDSAMRFVRETGATTNSAGAKDSTDQTAAITPPQPKPSTLNALPS